jgi:hypothetical protein
MSDDPKPQPGERPRFKGARPVADLVSAVIKPAVRKRGFASVDLVANWADIVGPAYADYTSPERLSWPRKVADGGEESFEPATLTVRCEGSRALLFQHDAPDVARRINAVFGFLAVGRIRIIQKPINRLGIARPPAPRPLNATQNDQLAATLEGIENADLKAALERLGRGVMGSKKT